MYCQRCGAQVDDQAAFCDKCGVALQKASPATTPGTAAYPAITQYAGFWRRLAAALIDGLIMSAVQWVIQLILTGVGVIDMNDLISDFEANPDSVDFGQFLAVIWIISGVMFIIQMLYFSIMESSSKQATLGKMVLGIVVTDADGKRISLGRSLGRNLGKIVSQIILFIGYFMVAFTKKKQGLHDMMANCVVVVKK